MKHGELVQQLVANCVTNVMSLNHLPNSSMLRNFVKRVIIEGKIENLQQKYKEDAVPVGVLAGYDPSPTKKYLEWICKQFKLEIDSHDKYDTSWVSTFYNDLGPTIDYFHRNAQRFQKKDINAYKTLKELENTVKDVELKSPKKIRGQGKAKKLYEDDKFLLVRPDDKTASVSYGAGTKWCITMKDANYYEDYVNDGVIFYFMIDKSAERDDHFCKVAFAFSKKTQYEIYNAVDDFVSFEDTEDNFGDNAEIVTKFFDLMRLDLPTAPLPIKVKIKRGIKVNDGELIEFWKGTFDKKHHYQTYIRDKEMLLSHLTFRQQKLLAKIDPFVATLVDNANFVVNYGRGDEKVGFIGQKSLENYEIEQHVNWDPSKQGSSHRYQVTFRPHALVRLDDKKLFYVTKVNEIDNDGIQMTRVESEDGEVDSVQMNEHYHDHDDGEYIGNSGSYGTLVYTQYERDSDGKVFFTFGRYWDEDRELMILNLLDPISKQTIEATSSVRYPENQDVVFRDTEGNGYERSSG